MYDLYVLDLRHLSTVLAIGPRSESSLVISYLIPRSLCPPLHSLDSSSITRFMRLLQLGSSRGFNASDRSHLELECRRCGGLPQCPLRHLRVLTTMPCVGVVSISCKKLDEEAESFLPSTDAKGIVGKPEREG